LATGGGSSPHRAEFPVSQFPGGAYLWGIGELAEAEGHHPNISFGWGNATVSLQTKKIKGLHENDFIMATKIDRIFARTATA
jgi:pterin-4a-carbinolamine dehydratase